VCNEHLPPPLHSRTVSSHLHCPCPPQFKPHVHFFFFPSLEVIDRLDTSCPSLEVIDWLDSSCPSLEVIDWLDTSCPSLEVIDRLDTSCPSLQVVDWLDTSCPSLEVVTDYSLWNSVRVHAEGNFSTLCHLSVGGRNVERMVEVMQRVISPPFATLASVVGMWNVW
jgi:hypothetical protein